MTHDAFGTGALRAAVLGAWQASPARLREDANHEEDHARGYYRDRVVVELAQNAADAATRARVPGRLLLRLTAGPNPVLLAANTGAPLDADGVASLASMRASAKRETSAVGRFGVGFAAVRAVSDEITVVSTTGAVRFSLDLAAEALAQAAGRNPALADEVARREGSLPVLRLPFAAEGRPPEGYDTAVVVELRDAEAVAQVAALLSEVGDPLLLSLPGLTEIVIEVDDAPSRRLADVEDRWLVVRAEGELDLALVADRPVEERSQRHWGVTWALPRTPVDWAHVVHAPTPSDEPCTLPALLIATLPLDPSRRHVAPGALTDAVLQNAAEAYGVLAARVAAGADGDPLALVPVGLAAGPVDGALRSDVVEVLRRTPLLRPAAGGDLLEPDRAVALSGPVGRDRAAVAALAAWGAGLVVLPAGSDAAARTVAVELHDLSEVVDGLPLGGDAAYWHGLYAALEPAAVDPATRELLAGLPVPLADGRMVRGVRGLMMLGTDAADGADGPGGSVGSTPGLDALARWGLRVVDPQAAHPLLERLGAQVLDAAGLLSSAPVRQAVLDCADDDDLDVVDAVTEAVLGLLASALDDGGVPPSARGWLGLLTLRADDDEPAPAHGLVLPGSPAAEVLDDRVLAPVHPALVERWGATVLAAAGVRADLAVSLVPDVVADPDAVDLSGGDLEGGSDDPGVLAAQLLDGWEEYLAHLAGRLGVGAYVGEVLAVADLDAVRDDAWPVVLHRLAREPELRRALLARPTAAQPTAAQPTAAQPAAQPYTAHSVTTAPAAASSCTASSYTAWWLRTRSGLGLGRVFATTGAPDVVRRLLPAAPAVLAGADAEVQRALGGLGGATEPGGRGGLGALDAAGWEQVLESLGEPEDGVDPPVAAALWRGLAAAAAAGVDLADAVTALPCVRAGGDVLLTGVEDAAVVRTPMWVQRTDLAALVPCAPSAAEDLAQALDLPIVEELADGVVDVTHVRTAAQSTVPDGVLDLLPGCPQSWREHEDLLVDGVPVDWWVEGEGPDAVVHATQLAGVARGLAQAAGRWDLRHVVEIALTAPERATELIVESAVDDRA